MPLQAGKSHEAFEQNLKTELSAGKPKAQALAIAYSKMGEAKDMAPQDWRGLLGGLVKFFSEEMEEPEHKGANDGDHETDSVGRVHLERVPISKATVNEYKGSEIPGYQELGLDADKLYALLRDPEELAKAAGTFNGIQLLIKHTPVSADDHKPYDIAGALGTRAEFEDPYLYNDVSVWTQFAIDGVEDKSRRELSSSYEYRPDMTPGTYKGVKYDGVMRDIVGNHTALVVKGRAGPDVAIDEAIPAPTPLKKEPPMSKKTVVPSRTAIRLQAALSVLAMDEKLNLGPVLKGVTAKNFKSRKPALIKGLRIAFDDLGATGATPDDVILKVLDMVGAQTAAEPEEADEAPMATEPNAGAPPTEEDEEPNAGGGQMDMGKLKEWLKSKGMSDDDMSELDGMAGDPAEDEDMTEEEKKAAEDKRAKDKAAKDAETKDMVTKPAMDAAIAAAVKTATTSALSTARQINEALGHVRPWVGELAMDSSINSAPDVYRKALVSLKVAGANDMHPDALKAVLEAQAKPGERLRAPALANDAAAEKSLADRFPHAARISNLG